mmetsp:Transcript_39520/g.60330  ORF Transcript_39520/g.60330 Transcript_39520/m.60330 type:complete len:166 (+) Transcript_39520:27-524(+)
MRGQSYASGYKKISHAQRINCVYLNKIHGALPPHITRMTGIRPNSVRNIIKAFEQTGRTNKKSTLKHSNLAKPGVTSSLTKAPRKQPVKAAKAEKESGNVHTSNGESSSWESLISRKGTLNIHDPRLGADKFESSSVRQEPLFFINEPCLTIPENEDGNPPMLED